MKEIRVPLILSVFGITAAFVLQLYAPSVMAQTPIAPSKIKQRPLVVGHRGAAGLLPENSLAAFKRACEIGVDAIELDIQVSADGELVVHHDYMLRPETTRSEDGNWIDPEVGLLVKDLSLEQLKKYDIGRLKPYSTYAAKYPAQTAMDGERIPTFSEVIKLFKNSCSPSARILVEIKTTPEKPELTRPHKLVCDRVVQMVREEGLVDRTWILSFDWRNLVYIQNTAPELETVYLTINTRNTSNLKPDQPGASPWLAGFDIDNFAGSAPQAVKAAGGRIWSPYYRNLTPELLIEAHDLGLLVSVWTPDTPYYLEKLIEMKVDAITTNRPDILKTLLSQE